MRSQSSGSESRSDPASTYIGKAERATMSAGSGSRERPSGAVAPGASGERAGAWAGSAAHAAEASDPRPMQTSRRAALGVSLSQLGSIDVGYQFAVRRANSTFRTSRAVVARIEVEVRHEPCLDGFLVLDRHAGLSVATAGVWGGMAQKTHEKSDEQSAAAEVFAEPDGTIVLRFRPQLRLTGTQTAVVARAQIALAAGTKRPVLADVRGLLSADRPSRQLAAGPSVAAVTACMAVVVGNAATRMLGNFFLKVTTPSYPTRIFGDEAEARVWLKQRASLTERGS